MCVVYGSILSQKDKNMDCEKVMVRNSDILEQALDIVVDDLVHKGDFVIDQIEDVKVIYTKRV